MGVVYDSPHYVCSWLAEQMGNRPGAVYAALGYERDGQLVAGVVFDMVTKTNVFVHIASVAEMFPGELLAAVARYVFVQNKLRRMTFVVKDTNTPCVKLIEKLGATCEGVLKGAHEDGDLFIYALWDTSRFYRKLIATGRVVNPDEVLT